MKRIRLGLLALTIAILAGACDMSVPTSANECDPTMGSGVDRACQ
jgi:hypothetical protein